ncbi:hypothetical protein C1H46_041711 [Malus baccata]|uniref:Uncharacterized protein n=1 Tax=Malus baccata TaxID=106549 RepID=A0A540KEU0_MALBA|nr:hypothetical protein C1H46_041711 [Malus baccata]
MGSSADDRRSHSGSSSDMSVYFEAEVPPNPNDEYATASSGSVVAFLVFFFIGIVFFVTLVSNLWKNADCVGKLERDVQTERKSGESSSAVRTSSGSSQLTASARLSQNQALSVTLAKLFDQRTPFRKKRKYIKQLATVKDDGTVQFDVPGDIKPQSLRNNLGHMVKNKGFLPSGPSEISIQRQQLREIIFSLLPACKEPDPDSKVPFKAEAIIANPPAYGHSHVAEALKVPLHIFFTMPWTPTSEFPHPLSRVTQPIGYRPLQEPEKMTDIILQALEITAQRGIINRGWGGLGNSVEPRDSVYLVDNCPHDWLFKRCSAVVHHGGAGTTAAGLKAACPTTIIPFFGDQPFWGERVHARGVGPAPIPVEEFSLDKLVDAIRFMLDPKVKECAVEIAKAMDNEDGVMGAVKAFHRHFPCNKSDDGEPDQSLPARKGLLSIRRCCGYSHT